MKPGLIEITDSRRSADLANFRITCQPHVAIKLRRMFGGIQRTQKAGVFEIAATPGRAYELDWFRKLHPLDVHPDAQRQWSKLVRTEKKRLAAIAKFDDDGYIAPDVALAKPLRDYQRTAVDMALTTRQLLLADEIGLGKSASAIGMLASPGALPALVVTMTHLPLQWEAEIKKFAPDLVVHRVRTGTPYVFGDKSELVFDPETGKRRRVRFPAKPDVIIMNYHKLSGWADTLAGRVRSTIWDEIQELRHTGTEKYKAARVIAGDADLRCGLSGTPIYNYGAEIYAVMDVIGPDALGSWAEFLTEWCGGASYGRGDNPNKIKVADPQALGAYLRETGLMLRRTRKDVGRELPPLTIVRHVVEADSSRINEVATDVRELAQRVLDRIGTPLERAHAARDIDYRMRQATGIAKAPAIADFVRLLVESGERVLLFLWHHDVYEMVGSLLSKEGHEIPYALYTGKQNEKEKRESYERFLAGTAKVLMMSNRSGAGLDGLQAVCHTVVAGELDWSPKVHEQNIGRANRDGQQNPVTAYYLVAEEGSDPVIADVLGIKDAQSRGIVDPYDQDVGILVGASDDHIRKLAEDVLRRTEHLKPASRHTSDDVDDVASAMEQRQESA